MLTKVVHLTIKEDDRIPDIISTFSPEENFIMLKIGSDCLREGRNVVAGLSQKEIYNKIKDETREQIEKMETNLIIQREMTKQMEDKITRIYEGQVEKLKKQLDVAMEQLKTYESQNKLLIREEVDKTREKYDILLNEKDTQNKLNRESIEKLNETVMKLTNKSTSHKGSEGEKQFSDYAEVFTDFKGFQILDKHTQGGSGDFHLQFEEFDILVDAKNYKKKVPIEQREKIKNDLLKNEHMNFAWLVSLNTSIDKWDKSPIMYEWISTSQCIVYINNLSSFEDPKKILRIVWYTCKELYKLTKDANEDLNEEKSELNDLKERNFKLMDKIKNIRKTVREINTTMNGTRNLIQVMDDELREILDSETTDILKSNFSLFDDWWNQNIESTNEDCTVVSTDLWFRFKQDNKSVIADLDITPDKFKQYIKSKVPLTSLVLRSKHNQGAFDTKYIKVKQKLVEEKSTTSVAPVSKIDVELVVDDHDKKRKIVKKI